MKRPPPLWLIIPLLSGIYLVYSLFSYAVLGRVVKGAFAMMGPTRIPGFYDLKWLLSFSACQGDIQELMASNARCFGYTNPMYPPLSIELGRLLGMSPDDANWVGMLFGLALILTIAHTCWLCTANLKSWSIIVSLLSLTFPMQIFLERGNIDAVLFLLLSLFCLVAWLPGIVSILLANIVNAFSISLKLYPWIGTLRWLIYSIIAPMTTTRKRVLNLSLILITSALAVYTASTMEITNVVSSGGLGSHGLAAVGYLNAMVINTLGPGPGRIAIYMLISLKLLSVAGGLLSGLVFGQKLVLPRDMGGLPKGTLADLYINTFIMVATTVGLGCYISNIGYDYRLIFLLPIIALVLSNLFDNSHLSSVRRQALGVIATAFILAFYLPFLSFLDADTLISLEMIDEIIAAPFLFSCLGGFWINLFKSLPSKVAAQVQISAPLR